MTCKRCFYWKDFNTCPQCDQKICPDCSNKDGICRQCENKVIIPEKSKNKEKVSQKKYSDLKLLDIIRGTKNESLKKWAQDELTLRMKKREERAKK